MYPAGAFIGGKLFYELTMNQKNRVPSSSSQRPSGASKIEAAPASGNTRVSSGAAGSNDSHATAGIQDIPVARPTLALLILFASTFIFITTELLPMGVLQSMGATLDQSEARIGFLVSAFALAVVLTSTPLASLTARLPRRPLLVGLVLALSVGNLVVGLSDSYAIDLIARFIIGAGNGVYWGMIGSFAARMVPDHKRGRALAMVFAGNTAALTLGIPLSAAAALILGWRTTFLVLGVAGLVLGALAWRVLPALAGRSAHARVSLRQVVLTPGVLPIALATLLSFSGHFALYTYITPYLQVAGIPAAAIAPTLFAFGIVGIAGVWLTGKFIERHARAAALTALSVWLGMMVILALLAYYPVKPLAIAACITWGLAYSAAPMLFQAAMLRAAPHASDQASAVLFTAVNLAITAGSVVGGMTLEHFGVQWNPLLSACCVLAALITVFGASRSGFKRDQV